MLIAVSNHWRHYGRTARVTILMGPGRNNVRKGRVVFLGAIEEEAAGVVDVTAATDTRRNKATAPGLCWGQMTDVEMEQER